MNADHEFQVNDNLYKKVRVHQLKKGDKLPKFELATDGGVPLADAYTLGAFCGDGFVDRSSGKPVAFLCAAESGKEIFDHCNVRSTYPPRHREGSQPMWVSRLNMDGELAVDLRDKATNLPAHIMSADKASALEFIAGWIDTDGNVRNTGACDNYRIFSTAENKLRDLQLLCRRAGINHAQLRVVSKAGETTNYGKRNHDLYALTIPAPSGTYFEQEKNCQP